jgi:dipeptidyl aminopeptidase/acylaminoacyl peptidase
LVCGAADFNPSLSMFTTPPMLQERFRGPSKAEASVSLFVPFRVGLLLGVFCLTLAGWPGFIQAADKEPVIFKGHGGAVLSASFSADGRRVLTCGADDTARLWEADNGRELLVFRDPPRRPARYAAGLFLAQLSPDGQRLLTISSSAAVAADANAWTGSASAGGGAGLFPGNAARLWDAATGKVLAEWTPDITAGQFVGVGPFHACFSPDGRQVATPFGTYPDCSVRVHETEKGKELFRLLGHRFPVVDVAFSPDGKYIATASQDETARLWDAQDGKLLQTFQGHICGLTAVVFSPDGKRLLTLGDGYTHRFEVGAGGGSSGSNTTPATVEETLARLWDVSSGKQVQALRWGGGDKGHVRLAQFSPDGKRILTAGTVGSSAVTRGRAPSLWDAATGKRSLSFTGLAPDLVRAAAFSPDGSRVAVAGREGVVGVWDTRRGKLLQSLRGHEKAVRSVVFSPDGKHLLTASEDGTARLWDAASTR